jgi:uridine kinase
MDDFFLRPCQRTPERFAEPGGNVDYERFAAEVLEPLKSGQPFSYQPFDCKTFRLSDPIQVIPKKLSIIEGSYSHHPHFGNRYDLKVFLTVSDEVRRRRIEERPAFLRQRFLEEWIPMEQAYFTAFSVAENCHILAMPEDNQ